MALLQARSALFCSASGVSVLCFHRFKAQPMCEEACSKPRELGARPSEYELSPLNDTYYTYRESCRRFLNISIRVYVTIESTRMSTRQWHRQSSCCLAHLCVVVGSYSRSYALHGRHSVVLGSLRSYIDLRDHIVINSLMIKHLAGLPDFTRGHAN